MKRGNDDEKVMGPMFPRLHINDKEKGGPRAPPRNKMALYEQLSIPSQRFNSSFLSLNPNNSSNTAPPPSSSQGASLERNSFFPLHLPPATPAQRDEKSLSHQSNGTNQTTSVAHLEQRKKADEEDFRVPVYVRSHMVEIQDDIDRDPKKLGSRHLNLRNAVRSGSEGHVKVSSPSRDQFIKSARNLSTGENIDCPERQYNTYQSLKQPDCAVEKPSRLCNGNACLQLEYGARSDDCGLGDGVLESTRDTDKGNLYLPTGSSPIEANIEYNNKRMSHSPERGNLDKNNNVSKASMRDTLSCMDISPDDVVGIIGQKHFWKARTAIVNQQRVFAVQVFELHRLIKVQQLIAGSPDLLVEDGAFLGKSSLKESPAKNLSVEYVEKPRPQVLQRKDDNEKLHKRECSAENAVGKTSLSSVKNGSHPLNYPPSMGNPLQTNVATDNNMGPWCFHQSPGHQLLVPVMSPSEGLVYKPYPGPGCGPFGPAPLTGNFMNTAYGVQASHQVIGTFPGSPPVGHSYFPPYGTPVMNSVMSGSAVEQMSQFVAPGPHGQSDRVSGGGAKFNMHNESSSDVPIQISEAISHRKFQASKGSELQGSTASSPCDIAKGVCSAQITEGRDALPLFPMATVVPQPTEREQPRRVIRVVPHNRRSATESAARIFQSIQEERKQFDSVYPCST
ncbi:Protein EARLY FLOWERING 3 [Quillaja saponaria]|uniref:Protein EARLY FLOWERING 3 n=1 Tax=Quillaja saponaria TaxID=32244 RepID=A0AAD7LHT5_QUISA|nr:Protein EARLY FLOWERING 3 [Quillaja saponaria]